MMNYVPTKDELMSDYFVLNLNHQQIAEKYGYKTRQVVSRWFKKYNITAKNKSQLAKEKFANKITLPTKKELKKLYPKYSISQISKELSISRKIISDLLKKYEIDNEYFKYTIDDVVLKEELSFLSLKEIEVKHSFPIVELKRRKLNKIKLPKIEYNTERLKQIFSLYEINNNGFSKQILLDDPNVYNSILKNTNNHLLQSDKITERIYRIINDFNFDQICGCKKCNSPLKFYTIMTGYGNSDYQICDKCVVGQCSSSVPSQELFWKICNALNIQDKCYFSELNLEKTILVTEQDKKILKNNLKLNKTRYSIDFMYEDKIIEFDGRYWHSDEEKEKIKDDFFALKNYKILHIYDDEYKNNPEETLNKCIEFLKS